MDESTRISPATRAALVAVSQGFCYFPGCRKPILISLGGRPEINIEIAQIRGADPDHPRYVAGLSDEDRDSAGNLVLLCVPHRRTVDRDPQAHPAKLLESWLPPTEDALDELGPMSTARFEDLLRSAFWSAKEQVSDALLRLEKTDSEAAQLLRHLLDGAYDQRSRYGVDPEIVSILSRVTSTLDRLVEPEPEPRRNPRPHRANVGWQSSS
jgi:hypothetical protein